jgi:hypothetical protein
MTSNIYRHVRTGEQIKISAAAYNAMLDAAQRTSNRPVHPSATAQNRDALFVHVVNDTDKFLSCYSVVGLGEPVAVPGDDNFNGSIVFRGVVPTADHEGKFAVIQQGAEVGDVVRACLNGLTFAYIKGEQNNQDVTEQNFCNVCADDTDYLVFSNSGAQVIWYKKESRVGVIRIGGGGGDGSSILTGIISNTNNAGATTIMVQTTDKEEIEVKVPYPSDFNGSKSGQSCRYYKDGNDWILLDLPCNNS